MWSNMKSPRTQGYVQKRDEFLTIINKIFSLARFIGISKYGINVAFMWSVILLLILMTIVLSAIWKVIRLLSGVANNTTGGRGLVGRLSGAIFYSNAFFSLILSSRFVTSWKVLSQSWLRTETTTALSLPHDHHIRKRVIFVSFFVILWACVEHIFSMMSATGFDFPPEEYFYRYILSSHGFIIQSYDYNVWLAIPVFVMSKLATLLWNFQDLIIILISMGLASRYQRLNLYLNNVIRSERKNNNIQMLGTDQYLKVLVWRKLREAYVRQADLVRQVDHQLGPLIVLSNINNLYFICLQLFFGIGNERASLINRAYYFLSLCWLIFRTCSVMLAASDVHLHSKRGLSSLYTCPGCAYNIEIKRLITQLSHDHVAITGLGLFSLHRTVLLQVAAIIMKYELVLIQYDYN